tara:strand:+ start:64 stop:336 length:273 start_codon:yes stop_codon:yes gene_type:complete
MELQPIQYLVTHWWSTDNSDIAPVSRLFNSKYQAINQFNKHAVDTINPIDYNDNDIIEINSKAKPIHEESTGNICITWIYANTDKVFDDE